MFNSHRPNEEEFSSDLLHFHQMLYNVQKSSEKRIFLNPHLKVISGMDWILQEQ